MGGASETSVLGKAGELRVASELLLRGHHPLIAAVDDGIDLTLGSGATIQVKTTRQAITQARSGHSYFVFSMHMVRGLPGARRRTHRLVADFAVLWCVERAFYIVPRAAVGGRNSISIPAGTSRRGSQWDRWREAWDQFDQGRN